MKASVSRIGIILVAICLAQISAAQDIHSASAGAPQLGARYATDAYPGFDSEKTVISPERKKPRWFAFIFGPNCSSAAEQLAYCRGLIADENYSKACRQLDALVREWPTSPEAPKAQLALAELRMQLKQYDDAFTEYRYLLDFFSLQIDYDAMADRLYGVAKVMKAEGKEVMFVHFENTVDVRRAYEACVLHAPGAIWVTEAMLTIGSLREDEGKFTEAVKVYENLRNLHPGTAAARKAIAREAQARMILLSEHGYNRSRCQDTISFLKLALTSCNAEDVDALKSSLAKARSMLEGEDYLGAKFYDSPTRTKRSAITAYEEYLAEYPDGDHAEAVRARLKELKGKAE